MGMHEKAEIAEMIMLQRALSRYHFFSPTSKSTDIANRQTRNIFLGFLGSHSSDAREKKKKEKKKNRERILDALRCCRADTAPCDVSA